MRLLLVDDEPLITTMLSHALRLEMGQTVEIAKAGNGQEALDALGKFTPDLIVSDLDMPVMSGVELHAALMQRGITIPFVFLTGADMAPGVLPAGVPVIAKQSELKTLVATIREYLKAGQAPAVAPEAKPVFAPRPAGPVAPSAEDLAGLIRLAAQDIREQLTVVRGYHNLIEPSLATPMRPHLAAARRSLARLGVIASDVSDWVKLGEGSLTPTLEPINVAMFLQQVLHSSQAVLDEAGVRLDTASLQRPPTAKADPRLLDRVLQSILEVVVLNTPRAQTLRVAGGQGPTPDTIGILFKFPCPRLPQALSGKLFDWQERDTLRRAGFQPGRGLGLAFARRATQAMGGRMEARMPREGELALGLALQASLQGSAPPPSAHPRILLILPSPIESNLLMQALRQAAREADRDIEVESVTTAQKGMEAIMAGSVAVLVADQDAALTDPAAYLARIPKQAQPGRTVLLTREGATLSGQAKVETVPRPQTLSAIQALAARIIKELPSASRQAS